MLSIVEGSLSLFLVFREGSNKGRDKGFQMTIDPLAQSSLKEIAGSVGHFEVSPGLSVKEFAVESKSFLHQKIH